jgi:predicted DNA-binding transcriptional regulator AlpA
MSRDAPIRSAYMRRQEVAFELGITRHTLARLLLKDTTFPQFFAITPGIEVIAREDLAAWIQRKRIDSRLERLVSTSETKND